MLCALPEGKPSHLQQPIGDDEDAAAETLLGLSQNETSKLQTQSIVPKSQQHLITEPQEQIKAASQGQLVPKSQEMIDSSLQKRPQLPKESDTIVKSSGKESSSLTSGHTVPLEMLTKKGMQRFKAGDNRVRPPKAATKLFGDSKWRHIRLPEVENALEAEDLVVMWGHYHFPEALATGIVVGKLLNFKIEHYDCTCLI